MLPILFIRMSRDGPYYVIGYGGWVGFHTGFHTINLVLYIGSLPNLTTWFPCGRGRTLFILGSLPLYRLIIYIDRRILWCTHFLLLLYPYFAVCFKSSLLKLSKTQCIYSTINSHFDLGSLSSKHAFFICSFVFHVM